MPLGCRLHVYLCRVLNQTNKRLFPGGLTGDLLSLGTVQALSALLPLATVPYLLRVVGLEAFGWYNLSLAVMNFGVAWVDFGFTLTGSRDKSALNGDPTTAGDPAVGNPTAAKVLFSNYFFTQLLLLGIGLPLLFLLVMSIPTWREHALFFLSSALLLPAQVLMPAWWLQGSRQFALLARWQVLGRLLFAVGVFSCIDSKEDQLLIPLLNGGSTLLVAFAAFFQVRSVEKIPLGWPGWGSCMGLLRMNRPVFLGGLSSALFAHSTLIILELFVGARWVGIVSALEKIILVFRMAASSLQQVLIPRLSAQDPEAMTKAVAYLRKMTLPLTLGGVGGSVMLWYMGPQILTLVAGSPQPDAEALLRCLVLLPLILAIGVLPSSLLLATKHNRLFGRNLMVAAAGGVGIHLLLVFDIGAWATITSLLTAELLLVCKNVASLKQILGNQTRTTRS